MLLTNVTAFTSPTDIANRALNHCGADHQIDDLLTDVSKEQRLVLSVYTKLRQAELRRNNWNFSLKRSVIRPIDTTSYDWTPPAYDAATTYRVGQVVSYDAGFGSRLWINTSPNTLAKTPGTDPEWDDYFGSVVAVPFDVDDAYMAGELVYVTPDDGTYKVYLSLTNGNSDDPSTVETWDATVTYQKGDIVVVSAQNYISLIDFNLNQAPASSPSDWATTSLTDSLQWVQVNGTLVQHTVLYPYNTGPTSQTTTANIFPLPYGYLRKPNQSPKAGSFSILGAPTNLPEDDWLIEGQYIISRASTPITLRFVADVTNVRAMDPMFCEGFGARIALEIAEPLTQSSAKLRDILGEYNLFMKEARLVNGIENGAEEPKLDEWITCRV